MYFPPPQRIQLRTKVPFDSVEGRDILQFEQENRPFFGEALIPYKGRKWRMISFTCPGDIELEALDEP